MVSGATFGASCAAGFGAASWAGGFAELSGAGAICARRTGANAIVAVAIANKISLRTLFIKSLSWGLVFRSDVRERETRPHRPNTSQKKSQTLAIPNPL